MNINTAIHAALQGMQRGMEGAQQNASAIARVPSSDGNGQADLVHSLVNLKENQLQVAASAKVLKHTDDMIGTLFDEMA